ncbi:cell cycle checkpoint [Exidia glandulosa HHB12029]|uniref:Checkpoint protein n=1 Tax=Exidia glandulosa HHB12029 TaxID=1314781 RepID=A0A165B212_EXIGL|nr:cell cycle checkpoint [Exidia glandulosa HHB12029]
MRFRATVENVQTFHRVVSSLEKMSKRCMIKLNETTMRIICLPGDSGVQLWSSIRIEHIFTDYRIQSNNNNEITFEISSEPLLAALKSALSSPEVVLKLTKKNDHATWSFEIAISSTSGSRMNIVHDVRVAVQRPADVARMKEPLCPEPDVHVVLPPLKALRTVLERKAKLSDVVAIRCNKRGCLKLAIETEVVGVETTWDGCTHPNMDDNEHGSQSQKPADMHDDQDPEAFASVLLPVKALIRFMNCHVVSTTTIAGLCQGFCVIMYVYIGEMQDAGGVLTFYIPAISDGDDD